MEKLTKKRQDEVKAELLKDQRYSCAICKNDLRRVEARNICLDHCHTSGVIRGVLCRGCNGSEGRIKNLAIRYKKGLTELQWLKNMVAYLEMHRIPQTDYLHSTFKTPNEKRELKNRRARLRRAKDAKGKK